VQRDTGHFVLLNEKVRGMKDRGRVVTNQIMEYQRVSPKWNSQGEGPSAHKKRGLKEQRGSGPQKYPGKEQDLDKVAGNDRGGADVSRDANKTGRASKKTLTRNRTGRTETSPRSTDMCAYTGEVP
jgi:hypothetical protein